MEHKFYAPSHRTSTNKSTSPNLTVTGHMERSSAISKRFDRLQTRLGYGQNQAFHSLRHTAMTMLEQADVPEDITIDIVEP
jgi:integrase